MKKFVLACLLLFPCLMFGQSAQRFTGQLSAACGNATTSCNAIANSQLLVGIGEYASGTVTVTGTFTGATIFFEFSDDGGNTFFQNTCTRTDVFIQEGSEVLTNSTNRAWDCGTVATSFFRIRLSAISSGTVNIAVTLTAAQIEPAPTNALVAIDPCQTSAIVKQSVAVNISSATTTQVVALSAGKQVFVCGYSITVLGLITTAGSVQFEYGTGSSCGTGTTVLTGTMQGQAVAGQTLLLVPSGGGTIFSTIASNALCLVTTGTAPQFQGYITFVQQ